MQVDGFSLDAQREKLKRYVEYEEMDIVGEYSDEGHSGKNITDKFYDRKYQDMADRQNQLYEQIGAYEEKIESVTKRIENIKQDKISGEAIYKILIQFNKLYDNFSDLEKKKFMQSFVDEVQIYEEENERGRFLKSISFKFPVYYKGKEMRTIEAGEDGVGIYRNRRR